MRTENDASAWAYKESEEISNQYNRELYRQGVVDMFKQMGNDLKKDVVYDDYQLDISNSIDMALHLSYQVSLPPEPLPVPISRGCSVCSEDDICPKFTFERSFSDELRTRWKSLTKRDDFNKNGEFDWLLRELLNPPRK